MAGFLYFVEGEPKNTADIISEHGLGYALESTCVLSPIPLGATPSGKPGCILADPKRLGDLQPSYRAELQTWQRLKDHWVGFWNEHPPKPTDLEHDKIIPGSLQDGLKLGDGNHWHVPLARQYMQDGTAGSLLPHKLGIDESGEWKMRSVVDRYAAVWELSLNFFDLWQEALVGAIDDGKDSFIFDYDAPQHTAIKLLATNYVISDIEATLLGLLLSDDTAGDIMRAACDCDLALLWIVESKKNEQVSAGLNTDDGAEDCTEVTPQLMPT